ncbi:MAG: head-tail connector protein [Christensenellaceae bacterium]
MSNAEELKQYLKVESDEDDTLIASMLEAATSVVEAVLRFPLTDFESVPAVVNQCILLMAAQMYENREGFVPSKVIDALRFLLAPFRKDAW